MSFLLNFLPLIIFTTHCEDVHVYGEVKLTANELSGKFVYSVALFQSVSSGKEERRAMRMLRFKWHCTDSSVISGSKSDTPHHRAQQR